MKGVLSFLTLALALASMNASAGPSTPVCDQKTRAYLIQLTMSDYMKIQETQEQVQKLEKAVAKNSNADTGQQLAIAKRDLAQLKAEAARKHSALSSCVSELKTAEHSH